MAPHKCQVSSSLLSTYVGKLHVIVQYYTINRDFNTLNIHVLFKNGTILLENGGDTYRIQCFLSYTKIERETYNLTSLKMGCIREGHPARKI